MRGYRMLLRALAAFLALPGIVAFVAPVWIGTSLGRAPRNLAPAVVLLCLGTALLAWCVREFYVAGRGTLAPWDPPRHLVTTGPYRISRNPMYVGVVTILAGWCTLWSSRELASYMVLLMIGFHLRVVLAEEPAAVRRFGPEWDAYRARVPRWIGWPLAALRS
jgi:protein-S-isoprenylcysteine O-methyltransferase Ste14